MVEQQLLRVDEAAAMLGIGRSKTYELIGQGELAVVRIGRAVRVPRSSLNEWIEAQTSIAVRTSLDARRLR